MINKLKLQVIDTLILIMSEYFTQINEYIATKDVQYPITWLIIGINTIQRVFNEVLIKTKSIDNACYYSQKAYYYYLEYMEQIYKSNIFLNLNHLDAILFIYKKTIFNNNDNNDDNENENATILNNIIDLQSNTIDINETELRNMLLGILKTTHILFYWKHSEMTFAERRHLCNNYLKPLILINLENSSKDMVVYLEFIQEKLDMNYMKYQELLETLILKKHKKPKLKSTSTEKDINAIIINKFFIENEKLQENFEKNTIIDFVDWLIV